MGKGYKTLSLSEATKFLNDRGQKSVGVHSMTKQICHWLYCSRCGLVNLKNEVTARALRAPCVIEE